MKPQNNNAPQKPLPPITECQVPTLERQTVQNINQIRGIIPQPEVIPQDDDTFSELLRSSLLEIEPDSLIIGENLNTSVDQPTDIPKQ